MVGSVKTVSRSAMLRGLGYCVEDEDLGAFSFSPKLLATLNQIVENDNRILTFVIDSLFAACEEVFDGKRERTSLGIEEWECHLSVGDIIDAIGNDDLVEVEGIGLKMHQWMVVASETVIGVGMVSKIPNKDDDWLIHSQPLWHLQATIYRDHKGQVCREPDGFILIPSEALRSLARHRHRIERAGGS